MPNEGLRPSGDDRPAEKQYCTSHTPESLSGFGRSYGLISEGPVEGRTAAVFAHGFTGDSYSTWQRFQTMIDEQQAMYPNFARWDIYFYDYRSLYGDIAVLAPAFVKFVHELYPQPQPKLFTVADPRIPEKYDNLILVGHSLGAVLIRQAVLDIVAPRGFDDVNLDYLGTADLNILGATLKLFAPATFGFNPTHLAGYFLNFACGVPPLQLALKPLLESNPPYKDLRPKSDRLTELRRRTEMLARRFRSMPALRAYTLYGSKEHIVYIERFDCDPVSIIETGQTHTSVCKPTHQYQLPLSFIYGKSQPASA